MRIKLEEGRKYDVVNVNGHGYLFTGLRTDPDSVPEGMYMYEVADGDCDGCFARIQRSVLVNFWGTIIGKHELPLDRGIYYPEYGTPEYEGDFRDQMTLEELIENDPVYEKEDPEPGEYAVFPGSKYILSGVLQKPVYDADPLRAAIQDRLDCLGVKIEEMALEDDVNLTLTISSGQAVRNPEVYDQICYTLEEEYDNNWFEPDCYQMSIAA